MNSLLENFHCLLSIDFKVWRGSKVEPERLRIEKFTHINNNDTMTNFLQISTTISRLRKYFCVKKSNSKE